MTELPTNLPKLPKSVDGVALPDFLNAKIIERDIKLPFSASTVPERYDFSIKKSNCFGAERGTAFDEGATWYPLQVIHFTSTSKGISSYRGHYVKGATSIYGKAGDVDDLTLLLEKDECITGFSGTFTEVITSLRIQTTKKQHSIGEKSGTPFEFTVPQDHHVVGFHGRADEGSLCALGVSYNRRLESLARGGQSRADPPPQIKPIYSELYLDSNTRQQWASNNMAAINSKRTQAQRDLQPIYDNIKNNGEKAWSLFESAGQRYYISWSGNNAVWAYVKDEPSTTRADELKQSIISIGSYSANSQLLGMSGYIWSNLPIQIVASAIALVFVVLMGPLITEGVAWGISFAAAWLTQAAAMAGVEALAVLIPASVASAGGLIIAGIIGVAVFLAVLWLSSIIFRQYFLTVNIFNFDSNHIWSTIDWYADNAEITNGEWKYVDIAKYAPAGGQIFPPGFDPPTNLESVVTYLTIAFTNVSTFLEGLGIAMVMGRDDYSQGFALKYDLPRFGDNYIGLMALDMNPNLFYNLPEYYNSSSGWVQANSTQTTIDGGLQITGYTPYLSGAPDETYEFTVNVGLPPPLF
ncbi:hypothetical protein BDP27DRAFT_1242393 [Rhodocollybia butyracea]|uniref:Jacalin-type lectin domain-containing protein n=1 Tax=Rhodocollybia butyracea TaxID=206335 RepID=A0A9P5TXD8_9AGAR|nr:hypothetical protein BDP27DRAFT_1242393 [Rhodocollybia butyracea]